MTKPGTRAALAEFLAELERERDLQGRVEAGDVAAAVELAALDRARREASDQRRRARAH